MHYCKSTLVPHFSFMVKCSDLIVKMRIWLKGDSHSTTYYLGSSSFRSHFQKLGARIKTKLPQLRNVFMFINKRTTKHLHISNIQLLSCSGELNVPLLEYGENPNLFFAVSIIWEEVSHGATSSHGLFKHRLPASRPLS